MCCCRFTSHIFHMYTLLVLNKWNQNIDRYRWWCQKCTKKSWNQCITVDCTVLVCTHPLQKQWVLKFKNIGLNVLILKYLENKNWHQTKQYLLQQYTCFDFSFFYDYNQISFLIVWVKGPFSAVLSIPACVDITNTIQFLKQCP